MGGIFICDFDIGYGFECLIKFNRFELFYAFACFFNAV